MSPLSYGVAPFAADLGARTQAVTLDAPSQIKPGATLIMKLTAAEPSRVAVLAIDEGILQVARYRNPDPLGFFFQKRMLEVETKQILDLILPEFKRFAALAAPGGDAEGGLSRHLNPFGRKRKPPVAYWSGVIDVGAGGTRASLYGSRLLQRPAADRRHRRQPRSHRRGAGQHRSQRRLHPDAERARDGRARRRVHRQRRRLQQQHGHRRRGSTRRADHAAACRSWVRRASIWRLPRRRKASVSSASRPTTCWDPRCSRSRRGVACRHRVSRKASACGRRSPSGRS